MARYQAFIARNKGYYPMIKTWCIARMAQLQSFLGQKGVRLAPIRRAISQQIILTVLTLFLGFCLLPVSTWILWIGVGLALGSWNFFGLSIFFMREISYGWSKKLLIQQLLRFQGRLLFSGIFMYGIFVWCNASPTAFVIGLLCSMVPVVFTSFFSKKV